MLQFQGFLRRQPELRRFALRLATRVIVGALTGVAAGALTLWVDDRAELTLPFPTANSQLLLGTLVGAIVTVAVFAIWMRTVVVGLASSEASPRVLTGYLDDRFQRNLTAWMMAGFAYLAAVTVALPTHRGDGVPAISSILSMLIVLGAISAVLVAMHGATMSVSMPQVVRTLTDRAFSLIDLERLPDDPAPSTPSGPGKTLLRAPQMGWVQDVDYDTIMAHLPSAGMLIIGVNVSEFVAEGEPLARADVDLDDEAAAAISGGFTIVPTRAPEYDLAYAIQQLVDVAEHAMNPSSGDTSTAYEAVVHLRAVFHRLVRWGSPTGSLRGDDGRWIIAENAWQTSDYIRAAFERLLGTGSQDRTLARCLLHALASVEETAREVGDTASEQLLVELQELFQEAMGSEQSAWSG